MASSAAGKMCDWYDTFRRATLPERVVSWRLFLFSLLSFFSALSRRHLLTMSSVVSVSLFFLLIASLQKQKLKKTSNFRNWNKARGRAPALRLVRNGRKERREEEKRTERRKKKKRRRERREDGGSGRGAAGEGPISAPGGHENHLSPKTRGAFFFTSRFFAFGFSFVFLSGILLSFFDWMDLLLRAIIFHRII